MSGDDIHCEQKSMFASVFFVTAVSWGFVCLLTTSFEDCLWDSVSWAFDDFVYMRVCLRVWHVCNSWCLCNGGNWGGDQMVEVNGKNFLPCFAHTFLI